MIKSNFSFFWLYYAEACNHFRVIALGNTASFKEISQRWQAVGSTVSDLTGPGFEPQTSRSRDERVATRPTGDMRKQTKQRATRLGLRRNMRKHLAQC